MEGQKIRLDLAMAQQMPDLTRQKAKNLIEAGVVLVNGKVISKPGQQVLPTDQIEVTQEICPYVSRGGLKLEKAIQVFPINLQGKTCLDIGASTGGFTDCMLQNGAEYIYAVDVGHGQLVESLRNDPRVCCMEGTNIRDLLPNELTRTIEFVSCDVSFIPLSTVIPYAAPLLKTGGECVLLIKPQFEAGKAFVGKKGIVRDAKGHVEAIRHVLAACSQNGIDVLDLVVSPIQGGSGNVEYLLYGRKAGNKPLIGSSFQTDLSLLVKHSLSPNK